MRFRPMRFFPAPIILAGLAGWTPGVRAQVQLPDSSVGTLLVAHGGGPEWNAQVEAMARQVRLPGPVGVTFLMGPGAKSAPFQRAVADLVARGARRIAVVPVLVSSHSGHYDQIRYLAGDLDSLDPDMLHHLHQAGLTRAAAGVPLRVTRAVDDAPEAAQVVADRAAALAESAPAQALFVIGHGPNSAEDYARWMEHLRRVTAQANQRAGFRSVMVELVRDDAAAGVRAEAVTRIRELIALQHDLTGRPVVVVPVLIAPGRISREKFPQDLAGLPIAYSGETLLPHPAMARWVESRVRESLAEVAATR